MVGVLRVETGHVSAEGVLLEFALFKAAQGSHEEVEVIVSGLAASGGSAAAIESAEGEVAIGLIAAENVELVVDDFSAEDDLVLAAEHGDIVLDGEEVVVVVRKGVGASADGELVADGDVESVGNGLIGVDA